MEAPASASLADKVRKVLVEPLAITRGANVEEA